MEETAMSKIGAETKAAIETAMVSFCTKQNITSGWSVVQHAKFQHGLVMEAVESDMGAVGEPTEETKFTIFVILRVLANYSAWRQAHEGEGKPLRAGTGRGTKSLAAEY